MTDLARSVVGRERELELVEQLLDRVCAGEARIVCVAGEPGIGKTRLLAEVAGRAEQRGCLVLEGGTAEFGGELPFGVLVDALEEYLESLAPSAYQRLAAEDLGELAGVFPALRSLDPKSDQPSTAAERFRAHRAVCALLEHLALSRPLLLVLDDLHWADGASLELVSHLLRRRPRAGLLVAVAFRRGQVDRALESTIQRVFATRTAGSISVRCREPKHRPWSPARAGGVRPSLRGERRQSVLPARACPDGCGG